MTSSQRARQRPGGFQESIAYPLLWPLRYAVIWSLLLLILALIAMSLDLVFASKVWPEGTALSRMESLLQQSATLSPNPAFADAFAEGAYWFFFVLTGVHDRVIAMDAPIANVGGGTTNLLLSVREELVVAMLGAKLFGVRLAIVINGLPLLLVANFAFVIDGLAERLIRRACAGRESATIFHLAKHSHFALLPVLLAVYLCLPAHFDPLWVVLPAILISGLLLRLQTKYYKKYV